MPVNERGQRVSSHNKNKNKNKQKAQANELRKPKFSTGGPGVGSVGGGT